jgi:UDP-glucose 4-epimerase
MNTVLVTGGAGFIGSHTVAELHRCGYNPVIVDDFSNSDDRVLEGLRSITGKDTPVFKVDCTDKAALSNVFRSQKPSAIIHFAAFKAVGESVAEPLKYYRNNLLSMLHVLELMVEFKVPDLVFSSSCTVYGQPDHLPVTEHSPALRANSPYGFTKQVCEQMIGDFIVSSPTYSAALLRYFNPIGAHPSGAIGELPFGVPNNLVPFIAQTAAGLREELIIYGDDYQTTDGTCVRDYIHVMDLARAHVQALSWLGKARGKCEAFNLGQGQGNTVMEVVKTFEKVTGQKIKIRIGKRRPGDVEKIWADPTKAVKELNWKTELSLEDALRDAWKWQVHLKSM